MTNIKELSEEDIKLRFITPAITFKGWQTDNIRMEQRVRFTDGKINLRGNVPCREKPKYADYILWLTATTPIAIVEAKDANHTVLYGLQQAMDYAERMHVPFAFSSNGEGFAEHDFLTGQERTFAMDEFPSYDELATRYKREANGGAGLSAGEEEIINQPYYCDAQTYAPRYYQRVAVNETVAKVAKGGKRALLVMATGTGKTYIAFQIVYRLLRSGRVKKVLYLADRNVLVDQSIEQDFKPLMKSIHKVDYSSDRKKKKELQSYVVHFALYQQLIGADDAANYKDLYKPGYFDLVIVDECHRGSAKDDSKWRQILDYFQSAFHLGMTATPKETRYQSSIAYFGEPVYTYSLKDGIDDGFLAPFRVVNITTNIGDEWRPTEGQRDKNGKLIEDRIYNNKDYDYNIVMEDRIREVAHEITAFLKHTDRMAKTIVFCADESHADLMRMALVDENADMCKINLDYVVRITGSDENGKAKLKQFISITQPYPVIATTSKLLSTGVDCKMVKVIALDQLIGSMTEFKQTIGRGTRIREKEGKLSFTIMDFRNVTRLFADPDWDGEAEQDPNYPPKPKEDTDPDYEPLPLPLPEPEPAPTEKPIVDRNGCPVKVINKMVQIYDTNGKLLHTQSIIDYTKENILGTYADLSSFINRWNETEKKAEIANLMRQHGIDIKALKTEQGMTEVDDFDFICHIAYGRKALTRRERAEAVRKRDTFSKYGDKAKAVINALLDKYMDEGVAELENIKVLSNDPFRLIGSPSAIAQLFGGNKQYFEAVEELKRQIYA